MYFLPPEHTWLAQAFRDHLDSYLDPSNRPTRSDDPRKFENSGRVYEPIYDNAQTHILSALRDGTLTAFVLQYDGRLFVVPKEYWDDDFADATLAEGEFHGIGKNLKDRPIILHTKDWENWTEEHARSRDRRADNTNAPAADQEQRSQATDDKPIELADASAATDTPKLDPYRTGLPGRPTIKHKILEEFQKRVKMNTFHLTLASEAEELRKWAEKEHPDAPRPTLGTIENLIRDEHRRAKPLPPNTP